MLVSIVFQVAVYLALGSIHQQGSLVPEDCKCGRLDESKPAVFVRFERWDRKNQRVWFRVHNNTKCRVFVPTPYEYATKTSDGKPTFDIADNGEVSINFEIVDLQGKAIKQRLPKGPYAPVRNFPTPLPEGRSAIFYVPGPSLAKRTHVAVPYKCDWSDASFDLTAYRAYFAAKNIPPR